MNASTPPLCIQPAAVPIEFMDAVNAFLREGQPAQWPPGA